MRFTDDFYDDIDRCHHEHRRAVYHEHLGTVVYDEHHDWRYHYDRHADAFIDSARDIVYEHTVAAVVNNVLYGDPIDPAAAARGALLDIIERAAYGEHDDPARPQPPENWRSL